MHVQFMAFRPGQANRDMTTSPLIYGLSLTLTNRVNHRKGTNKQTIRQTDGVIW